MDGPILLFDGVCNLCNGAVQFVIDHDPRARVRFAPLQSAFARELLAARGQASAGDALDTVVLVDGDRVFTRSDAALRVARALSGAWPALYVLVVVPRFLRDAVYRFLAARRYRWFGHTAECRVPTPELRARFLA